MREIHAGCGARKRFIHIKCTHKRPTRRSRDCLKSTHKHSPTHTHTHIQATHTHWPPFWFAQRNHNQDKRVVNPSRLHHQLTGLLAFSERDTSGRTLPASTIRLITFVLPPSTSTIYDTANSSARILLWQSPHYLFIPCTMAKQNLSTPDQYHASHLLLWRPVDGSCIYDLSRDWWSLRGQRASAGEL